MKPFRTLLIGLLAAGMFSASVIRAAETPEQMIAAAKELEATFLKAFNAADSAGFAALYWKSPDVVSFPPDTMAVRGWDAIKASSAGMFKAMPGAKLEMLEAKYMTAGDVVISYGTWRLTMKGPDGKAMTSEGRYTDIMAKRDGKWVFIHDHASAPLPPPPGG